MTFPNTEKVSYTKMCIYIDTHAYGDNPDCEKIYIYLYHIMYMLARKAGMFKSHHLYDNFALFSANRLYFRLFNKKQFELKENGEPKMTKLTSILNYAKRVLYPLKVDFEQSEYCQNISKEIYPEAIATYNYETLLHNSVDTISAYEFRISLRNISKTCRKFLSTIPVKKDSAEWLNLYISVMLTFLSQVTLSNRQKDRLEHLKSTCRLNDSHIDDAYYQLSIQEPILYHLDDTYRDYVLVLVNELKMFISKELSELLRTNATEEALVLNYAVNDYAYSEGDEDEH